MIRRLLASLLCLACSSVASAQWQPAKGPLMTRWAKDVSPDKVHPEYPRPQLVRKEWTNLNGLWDYKIADGTGAAPPKASDGKILVPFPIESALSGVMKHLGPKEAMVYYRTFDTPLRLGDQRVLLHFGAVDWSCTVKVNNTRVGTHIGGYDPFTFDITDALLPDVKQQDLSVLVMDPTDANWQPRGKQVARPNSIWYTPTTGIWQTVWLEVVPKAHIANLRVVPDLDLSQVRIQVEGRGTSAASAVKVIVQTKPFDLTEVTGRIGDEIVVKIPDVRPWSPSDPYLYNLSVVLEENNDVVTSYFGMRKISLGKDDGGVTRLMLNGKPVFQYGPLDQGFWPDGLYTAPTDEAMRYDLEVTKQLGFNMIRKHVKVEPARWYHYCDKLGLLVWQDMPSGDKYIRATDPDNIRSPESIKNYENEWREIVTDLGSFPCIVMWVPFNEGWGQFDTARIVEFTHKLDPTRLVDNTSGWADRKVGDVHDVHVYPGPGMPPLEPSRAAVLGEFGGLGLPLEGHTWQAKDNWGYRSYKSREELASAYEQLIFKLRPLIGKGLSAAVYTQTTDVEVEVNGLMTYDREVIKLDPEKTAALHKKLYQPPPQEIVIVPTSQQEPQKWRYTTAKPADGWEKAVFDDASWTEAEGGFGEPSTPGSKVRTNWKTADIWLRRKIELPAVPNADRGYALAIHHDEDVEVYLNGTLIATEKGYTTDYALAPLDEKKFTAAIKPEGNVLAVHCHQTGGGQYIDVGLVRLEETPAK